MQHFRDAHDPVHGGADFMAHVGEEDRFRLVGAFRRVAGLAQAFLELHAFGDVHMDADHAAVGQPAAPGFDRPSVLEMTADNEVFSFPNVGNMPFHDFVRRVLVAVVTAFRKEPQSVLEVGAFLHEARGEIEQIDVMVVVGDEPKIGIKHHDPVVHGTDGGVEQFGLLFQVGFDGFQFGNVRRGNRDPTVGCAALAQQEPATVRELADDRRSRVAMF